MKRTVVSVATLILAPPLLTGCVVAATTRAGGGSGGGGLFFLFLPFLVFLFIASRAARAARGGHRRERYSTAADRRPRVTDEAEISPQMVRAELSVLADDVLRLEPQVALREEARDDYEAATHRYRVAQAALDNAPGAIDMVRVQRVVDEARYSMARARAILDGRRPPEPPPMLQQPGVHGEPAVQLDARANPVYVGSPATFRSGWFGAGGGLFGGLLLGSMLGGWVIHETSDDGFGGGDDSTW